MAWTDDLRADVRTYLDRLYDFMARNPRAREILRLLIAEASRFPELVDRHFDQFSSHLIEPLRTRFAHAIARGEMPEASIPELPEVVLGPVLSLNVLMLLFANRRSLDPARYMATHRSLLLDGLLSRNRHGPAQSGLGAWTEWRRLPDPRRGEMLTAPLGAGLYELRLTTGELVLITASRNVASEMSRLLPDGTGPGLSATTSQRTFLRKHLEELEYRVMGCATFEDACARAADADASRHKFPA